MNETPDISLIRIMQLFSSTLPVGGFTYSQGLEWAVECGWVTNEKQLGEWLADLIDTNLRFLEIPLLLRMFEALDKNDLESLEQWSDILLAYRETKELRLEEINRGRAMAKLLMDLGLEVNQNWLTASAKTQTAGIALAMNRWKIPILSGAQGFAMSWLENMIIAGVKLIPLGQAAGQRILMNLAEPLAKTVEYGITLDDEQIGCSSPGLAHASACHETQYTRLFRS